jgi:hypothetical protein
VNREVEAEVLEAAAAAAHEKSALLTEALDALTWIKSGELSELHCLIGLNLLGNVLPK